MRFRNHHAGCCGYVPTRSDGSEWSHVLTLRDGSTVYADTADEVLAELVDGWEALGEQERADALVRHAAETAAAEQQRRTALAVERGALDLTDPGDRALLPLLEADKRLSLLLQTPDRPGEQADWHGPVELVLLTTSYRPVGEHPPIGGRTVWLDPSSPEGYLASLGASGAYDYWRL
ncbi:hypothetical protein [Arsenicicoccus dermatophilus]|uniref:hypothetical protein n=1 Tax=Arsenicicoccus dermatophilus TaxID=1076331 RepID=UPI0039172CA1